MRNDVRRLLAVVGPLVTADDARDILCRELFTGVLAAFWTSLRHGR